MATDSVTSEERCLGSFAVVIVQNIVVVVARTIERLKGGSDRWRVR